MTLREMEEVLLAHEIAELEQDVEATMATLAPNPHYELAFVGLAVDGEDAVRETYRRILSGNQGRDVAAEARVYGVAANTLMREAHMTFTTRQGERVNGLYLVVMSFDPETKLICGERMYTDPLVGEMMTEQLGANFESLPGVTRIRDTAPTIAQHDAFRDAEAQGRSINVPG
ncbi:hypothetical protein HGB45_04295 [Nocardia cerradoensis]|nr:hypothetical protein [Nocardia cerradoensis]